ncbi:MAG: hypothetical protein IJP03_04110, partial [Christensenellaceae bacterium]|nr:hypothetical protein [Christensenellaceae bacterium]
DRIEVLQAAAKQPRAAPPATFGKALSHLPSMPAEAANGFLQAVLSRMELFHQRGEKPVIHLVPRLCGSGNTSGGSMKKD